MSYFPVSQSLTRNIKIASFDHSISRAEARLLDSYKERLERIKQIKQQQNASPMINEVLDECQKSERLALEALQASIQKTQEHNYGLCQSCHKPIDENRLTILPDIKHCFDCSH
ncbi:MAG: TraR/DksA C4-type zinc finger protein [Marinomonas sp.]|jgi:RNA polymerase-binding transcription factor DksA|uniref:TraR/DksA C4-type zinc finger protein n=1 Tax=unclassified Marinomonas TaxID=196814 RepID=UPI0007AF964C|nr:MULTISPECIES: TraR/DksA C4-type zinc finger protein [unclassified Marinomonas]KZM44206.1 hypothetical protein OA92_05805 [Marinomonas sp. SBI22]KZM45365.1 hypothetical protein OA91_06950 [Marinomonas sp. SBI8L]